MKIKKLNIVLLISLLLYFNAFNIKAQHDTIININPVNDYDLNYKQKYLNENLREEKNLIKFILMPRFKYEKDVNTEAGLYSSLTYERKIIPSLSVLLNSGGGGWYTHSTNLWYFSASTELRYYYSMKKRIKESIGANNFHSNYFAFGLMNLYAYGQGLLGTYYNGNQKFEYLSIFEPNIQISWGIQRRIGKWAFYDIKPYYTFYRGGDGSGELGVSLSLGLAWGW